ncbi:MAG: hypothetical protein GC191_13815 [Azospirillum sp.]|nr:hypothetical protein [Azospirillum sp.]
MDDRTTTLTIIGACIAGIVFFAYMKIFLYMKYRQAHEKALKDAADRPLQEAARQADLDAQREEEKERQRHEQVLYLMHQEQIRRLLDHKMEIVKSVAAAQNQLTATRADIVRLLAQSRLKLIESGQSGNPAAEEAMAAYEREIDEMVHQQEEMKKNAEQRLAEIDAQIRAMPGGSTEAWIAGQNAEAAMRS